MQHIVKILTVVVFAFALIYTDAAAHAASGRVGYSVGSWSPGGGWRREGWGPYLGWGSYYSWDYEWPYDYDYSYPVSRYCVTSKRTCVSHQPRYVGMSCFCKGARGRVSFAEQ